MIGISHSANQKVAFSAECNTLFKIRLAGIDAPEKSQAFGQASKKSLSDCAYGKSVIIQSDKTDRYKRLVGKVIINGFDCNLNQVKLGMAWHYKKYQREQSAADRITYLEAEEQAQNRRLGLWADASPVAPWDFRHK